MLGGAKYDLVMEIEDVGDGPFAPMQAKRYQAPREVA